MSRVSAVINLRLAVLRQLLANEDHQRRNREHLRRCRELHDSIVARGPVLDAVSRHLGQRLSLALLQRPFAPRERLGSAATPARSVRDDRPNSHCLLILVTNRIEQQLQRIRFVTGHCATVDELSLSPKSTQCIRNLSWLCSVREKVFHHLSSERIQGVFWICPKLPQKRGLDDCLLRIVDEHDDVGQFHRHLLPNIQARWDAGKRRSLQLAG